MKQIEVVAAIIHDDEGRIFATQRGYGDYKDGWEFPGGKMEPGESPEEALKREIWEELETRIQVERLVTTVDWDYPALANGRACSRSEDSKQALVSTRSIAAFHLTMHCYLCSLQIEALHLNEHEAAKWLTMDELDSVKWLPADVEVVEELKDQQN
jgi:8-oxo-dGTP diphosphatase